MNDVEKKLLLAYVYNCRKITRYDKRLHKDFFYFKMIMCDEFDCPPNLYFELINETKGEVEFNDEPYCHALEMLVFNLIQEGDLEYVNGEIDITRQGYSKLVELRRVVDPIAPSVKYMSTRLNDDKYDQRYRNITKKMKDVKERY